jgi:uncharacterized protein YbbK (DUF523 family)
MLKVKIIRILPEEKRNVLVSSCLLGYNCRYDGFNNEIPILNELVNLNYFSSIPVCPEHLGGLKTPRNPCEIIYKDNNDIFGWKISDIEKNDFSDNFEKGSIETVKLAKIHNVNFCIMKEKSPSCGVDFIYDGTFSKNKTSGMGISSFNLNKNGFKVISSDKIVMKKGLFIGMFEEYYESYNPIYDEKIKKHGAFILE